LDTTGVWKTKKTCDVIRTNAPLEKENKTVTQLVETPLAHHEITQREKSHYHFQRNETTKLNNNKGVFPSSLNRQRSTSSPWMMSRFPFFAIR
jgi:hypothetical protein